MKISGTHIETITSSFQRGMAVYEDERIKSTTEMLSKEGKHIINISHGNVIQSFGEYRKSITFIWEADDTDPVYIKAREKAEKEQKQEQLRAEKIKEEKHKKQVEFVQKGLHPLIKIVYGVLLGILGIGIVICFLLIYFSYDENILYVILSSIGVVVFIISLVLFIKGCRQAIDNYCK